MQNRKDLLQAHRLMTQRAALALLCGEPDSPNQPLRRLNVGTLAGILVAAVVAAVIAVIGFLAPGTVTVSGLTQPGTLVIDKDTATAYVPCENGKLCPAVNYASALLALDTASVDHVAVSQASIAKYPIGPTIGISGLPADLPLAASLVKGPWSVCASGLSSTLVGGVSVGGTRVGSGDAVLVVDPQDAVWVVWHGERLLIADRVVAALFGNAQPVQVDLTETLNRVDIGIMPSNRTPPIVYDTHPGVRNRGILAANPCRDLPTCGSTCCPHLAHIQQEGQLSNFRELASSWYLLGSGGRI
jgi:hypothetical protein